MLNKAPNNKDVVCIVNIMLNEASNSNDAMDLANNVCLTIMGAQQFLMAVIQSSCRKVNLPEMRDNDTQNEKGSCRRKINLGLGKNGGYMASE